MRRLAVLLALVLAPAASAAAPSTTRIALGGAEPNGASGVPVISANGRYVAFASEATNLVPDDTNGKRDVFLHDRATGTTRRVSVGPGGEQLGAMSYSPGISGDGRYVAFGTDASNWGATGLVVWDRETSATRVAATHAGMTFAFGPVLSRDGARLGFSANDGEGRSEVLAAGLGAAGAVVSRRPDGGRSSGESYAAALSDDGRWIAWNSPAADLVAGDANGVSDVFAQDLVTGERVRASVASDRTPGNASSYVPSLDAGGCLIAFSSNASNLLGADSGSAPRSFLRDRCKGTTELLSVKPDGAPGLGWQPVLSADGCTAAFNANGWSPGQNGLAVRDRCARRTELVDVAPNGASSDSGPYGTWDVSATGRYVAWASAATNLVPGDGNGAVDVFVRDRATNTPPVARLAVADLGGGRFRADASGSTDPDGWALDGRIAWGSGPVTGGLGGEQVLGPGTHTITATVVDADGAASTAAQTVTVAAPSPAARVLPRPLVLDRLKLSRTRFAVAPRRGRARGNQGATLALRLSDAARVTLVFERVRRGRKRGTRCVVGRRRGARCTKVTRRGALTRALPAGAGRIALTGRTGTKALARGSYRLVVRARTADGRAAAPRTLRFSIVRATRR